MYFTKILKVIDQYTKVVEYKVNIQNFCILYNWENSWK